MTNPGILRQGIEFGIANSVLNESRSTTNCYGSRSSWASAPAMQDLTGSPGADGVNHETTARS